ncbi:lipoprotein insertase outer membrane protein LolB [Teredinibacter sp. KSP-S5-2]|uniref:lipoprotein insertase outer membrane protein LolB n=1 Tax=Teredinibacter sp. KSP-S5-2 TaxID=3034506 RepID=UPI002934CE6E|nr:lipoprotein insertase outer membrane protein LolB [Teredinibacter sp. KSP-S5-2]WNO09562.1 lipoprotein insertase outer membrane protein LolB [Teredinibacter sp. KSP-S5-2]
MYKKYSPNKLFFFSLLLIVAGCSTSPHKDKPQFNVYKNAELKNWSAEGKVGLRMYDSSRSASFSWKQRGKNTYLHLWGPFGQGSVYVTVHNGETCLQQGNVVNCANSPEELLKEQVGWTLPVSDLIYWIKAVPSPRQALQNSSLPNGTRQEGQLKQNDWLIEYRSFHNVDSMLLPKKIVANRGTVKMTLAIKDWKTH